jgi:hypothetical protein
LGEEFAARYEDFCFLIGPDTGLKVDIPLATHAMREMESMLRSSFLPMAAVPGPSDEETAQVAAAEKALAQLRIPSDRVTNALRQLSPTTQRTQIVAILKVLGIEENGDVAKAWMKFARVQAKWTHGRSWRERLKIGEEFQNEVVLPFKTALMGLTERFERNYRSLMSRVDALAASQNRLDAVESLAKDIPYSMAVQRRFFEMVAGDGWLVALTSKGFYADRDETHPAFGRAWYPGLLLVKCAASAALEERTAVCSVVNTLAETADPEIRYQLVRAVNGLPPAEAVAAAPIIGHWLGNEPGWDLLHATIDLVIKLAGGGVIPEAVSLARRLLQLEADEVSWAVTSSFDRHGGYQYAVERLSPLSRTAPGQALAMLCDLIEQVGEQFGRFCKDAGQDRSLTWRAAIADDEDNVRDELGALISAARDAAELASAAAGVVAVVEALEERQYPLFRRLALHVLAQRVEEAPDLADARLTATELIGESWCEREYAELALARFANLAPELQAGILGRFDMRVDQLLLDWQKWFERDRGRIPTPEEERRARLAVRRDMFWHWQRVLPGDRREELTAIVDEIGGPRDWMDRVTAGPTCPVTADQMAVEPVENLLVVLSTLPPDADQQMSPSSDAIRHLREAVSQRPAKFAIAAGRFVGLSKEVINGLLSGLLTACRNKEAFDWVGVLDLLDHVVRAVVLEPTDAARQQGATQAAELLKLGFMDRPGRIPAGLADQAWLQVAALLTLPANGDQYQISRLSLFDTTRTPMGAAIQAAVWYAVRRLRFPAVGDEPVASLADLPVGAALDGVLADRSEAAAIKRVVLGSELWRLLELDWDWTLARIKMFLPFGEEAPADAVWIGHLQSRRVTQKAVEALGDRYLSASTEVATLEAEEDAEREDDRPSRLLAAHIVRGYLEGWFELDDGGPLNNLVVTASDELRGTIISWMGRWAQSMAAERQEVAAIERACAYWEARNRRWGGELRQAGHEVRRIGEWVRYPALDAGWLLQELLAVLRAGFLVENAWGVVSWSGHVCTDCPAISIELLDRLLLHPATEPYLSVGHAEEIKAVLHAAVVSGIPEAITTAEGLVSALAARGNTSFLDAVTNRPDELA